ncbi:MAG TPA: BamA/TamA family outer membrane protein [Gemmatimonadales bacterium]|nr:BamA/TamA family outer membrane protein [Gemmatimonadales bacterium]
MFGRPTRGPLLALAALAAATIPSPLSAQYFGQNKVQYEAFDFKVLATEHFDVYFYERERTAALDMARMAERSYARLSRVLNHQFRERKPIILYASHSDFIQTNATPGEVGEGTGGFTDFLKHRNIFPLTGSYTDNEEVLMHEMVHQFQYDIWSGGKAGSGLATIIAVNPPLWFVEGMAAYLSRGPYDTETTMILRDAALEGKLPTIDQMTNDPRIFPYRFGQALISYIGERWGDEAIGAILQGSRVGGLEAAFRRTTGLTFAQLSEQWRDAVLKKYLPEIGSRVKASAVATPLLTEEKSDGTLHLAPALSPDGSLVAYFSEADFYFVDLYLADGVTGEREGRLFKSTFSSNYETFRFINSSASFSPDGKFVAVAGKRGPKDEILIIDVERNRQVGRIKPEVDGITTPSWSPDGTRLVFTGYTGGISDLFVVGRDGQNLQRLTNDKYADFHPVWSPDGRTIAFSTDRGESTDFETLQFGNWRIATYDLDMSAVRVLDQMESGRNVSPQWSPDGASLAFVSDRNGVANIFLYELASNQIYQLTDFYTGVQGITGLSPVLSWAQDADRIAFVYYENNKYDVYSIDDPRSRRRAPYEALPSAIVAALASTTAGTSPVAAAQDSARPAQAGVGVGGSLYRSRQGFRSASELAPSDSGRVEGPVSIVALLDSATLALPDSTEFTERPYRVRFSPDYVARPSIGYTRDTFGRGFFGGSTVALSDMLGNHQMVFSGYVNGNIIESQILAAYANLSSRINWAAGLSQDPYFFLEPSEIRVGTPFPGENTFVTNIRRIILRQGFAQAAYPFNRFRRVEASLRAVNVSDDMLEIREPYDPVTGFPTEDPSLVTVDGSGANYLQPALALVHDNALFGYTGPFFGRRWRFEAASNIGSWRFSQLSGDYRRYDQIVGPIVFATQLLYFGRIGRDAQEFRIFAGTTELLRGHTSGSYRREECFDEFDEGTSTGCVELDRLVGTQIAVGKAELRFPLLTPQIFKGLPLGVPPIEGAFFYDVGLTWDENSTLRWRQEPGDEGNPAVRVPLHTVGASLRTNLLGFVIIRLDYSRPINRPGVGGLWTVSLGPTF